MTTISEVSPGPRKRGRPRDPSADGRILSAAVELLIERGFDAMTVDDVARRAGVGKATVYRRWPSKDQLAFAAVEQLFANQFTIPDTGSLRSDLTATLTELIEFANSQRGFDYFRTRMVESLRDERIREIARGAAAPTIKALREMYRRGVDRGEVREDADLTWPLMTVFGLIHTAIFAGYQMPTVDDVTQLVDFQLAGIARPS